jgi:hypothetical protein
MLIDAKLYKSERSIQPSPIRVFAVGHEGEITAGTFKFVSALSQHQIVVVGGVVIVIVIVVHVITR